MTQNTEKKRKIFDIKLLPMDFARFLMTLSYPFIRVKKYGIDGKPYRLKAKGAVIAANHLGFSDPPLFAAALWFRRTFMLAAEAVMDKPVVGTMLKGAGCIKIDRNTSDIDAVRRCTQVLKDGRLLLIFPQGRIVSEEDSGSIKSGAVLIASQADVPIIPAYSGKRRHFFGFRRIVFGEPIYCRDRFKRRIPSMQELDEVTALLQDRINDCRRVFEDIEGK